MQASVQHRVLIDALVPNTKVVGRINQLVVDIALVVGGVLLVAICAQIAVRIPTTTVPITGQTFGVLLAGGALGSRRGSLSMLAYMMVGIAGLPVFAPGSSPLGEGQNIHFILPWSGNHGAVWDMSSGGYIVGFIMAAYLVGFLAERGWDRRASVPLAMLLGNLSLYLPGLLWMAYLIGTDWIHPVGRPLGELIAGTGTLDKTLRGGLYPFITGDALKLLLAAMVLPGAWTLIDRLKR